MKMSKDTIYRQDATDVIRNCNVKEVTPAYMLIDKVEAMTELMQLLSTQPKPLTDKEQRIFLAAIAREIKVCEEEDKSYMHESCEDSLVQTCNEIKRKVKDALWT